MIGLVLRVAKAANSRETHAGTKDRITYGIDIGLPGSPNRWGITAVQPMSTTRFANSHTPGVMPGISEMTMTAGPVPFLYTSRVFPPWVKVVFSKPSSGSAMGRSVATRPVRTPYRCIRSAAMAQPFYVRLAYDDEIAACDWLCRVFGFKERERKENPGGSSLIWLELSDGEVMICRSGFGLSSPRTLGGVSHRINVYLGDVDTHYERSRAGGATIQRDLEDMPWGDRRYEALDIEGHWWHFAQRLAT